MIPTGAWYICFPIWGFGYISLSFLSYRCEITGYCGIGILLHLRGGEGEWRHFLPLLEYSELHPFRLQDLSEVFYCLFI